MRLEPSGSGRPSQACDERPRRQKDEEAKGYEKPMSDDKRLVSLECTGRIYKYIIRAIRGRSSRLVNMYVRRLVIVRRFRRMCGPMMGSGMAWGPIVWGLFGFILTEI